MAFRSFDNSCRRSTSVLDFSDGRRCYEVAVLLPEIQCAFSAIMDLHSIAGITFNFSLISKQDWFH